ncbi:hypothetical protein EDD18DRAFT_1078022, partial [Armillaria luteobubalina]
ILIYPWLTKSGTNISNNNLDRLHGKHFLNDNLISVGLMLVRKQLARKNEGFMNNVYFFSSFWFPKLQKVSNTCFKRDYTNVQHWTSKIDIFAHKYVIVLIHKEYSLS